MYPLIWANWASVDWSCVLHCPPSLQGSLAHMLHVWRVFPKVPVRWTHSASCNQHSHPHRTYHRQSPFVLCIAGCCQRWLYGFVYTMLGPTFSFSRSPVRGSDRDKVISVCYCVVFSSFGSHSICWFWVPGTDKSNFKYALAQDLLSVGQRHTDILTCCKDSSIVVYRHYKSYTRGTYTHEVTMNTTQKKETGNSYIMSSLAREEVKEKKPWWLCWIYTSSSMFISPGKYYYCVYYERLLWLQKESLRSLINCLVWCHLRQGWLGLKQQC